MKWRSLEESGPSQDKRPLSELFAERKALIAKYVPPETHAIHAQAIAELKEKGLAGRILLAGGKFPAFTLKDHNDRPVSSAELLSKGDRKSTRLNSSHQIISYAVFCLKKKNK